MLCFLPRLVLSAQIHEHPLFIMPLTSLHARRSEITQFNTLVSDITSVFEAHATQIETEKLKAIGLRNLIDMQKEKMRRKERELKTEVDETNGAARIACCVPVLVRKLFWVGGVCSRGATTGELERATRQYDSLVKISQEQQLLLDKLSNSEL